MVKSVKSYMNQKDAKKRQAVEQVQERIKKVSDAHGLLCERINSAIKSINEALATGILLDKAINAGLDTNLRLGKRLRLPSVVRDLMTAKYKLSVAVKLSKSIAPIQFQIVQESLVESLVESEPDFE
jgi:hypothetical protein